MNIPAQSASVSRGRGPRSLIIRTTLYDLIAAINAEVGADDDDLAVAAVVHLLTTQRLTSVRPSKLRRSIADRGRRIRRHCYTMASTVRSEQVTSHACEAWPCRSWSPAGTPPSSAN